MLFHLLQQLRFLRLQTAFGVPYGAYSVIVAFAVVGVSRILQKKI
jgi:hypothetical protein